MAMRTEEPDVLETLTALRPGLEELDRAWSPARRQAALRRVWAEPGPSDSRRVAQDRPRVGGSRWIGAGLAVAAITAAAFLLVPGAVNLGRPVEAVPAQTPVGSPSRPARPGTTGTWVPTSPPPLSPRHDSIAAWVDDSYVIVGGFTGLPCPPGDEEQDCGDLDHDDVARDGARYHPATDSWTSIPDAPAPLFVAGGAANPYQSAAVIGRTLYVLAASDGGMVSYDLDADRWESIAAPSEVAQLFATDQGLVGYGWGLETVRYWTWDPATRQWSAHDTGTTIPTSVSSANVVGGQLIVSALSDPVTPPAVTTWVVTIDLDTGRKTVLAEPPLRTRRPTSVVTAGLVGWPRAAFSEGEDEIAELRQVWFLHPRTGDWSSVELPEEPGGLRGRTSLVAGELTTVTWNLTTDTMVGLRGYLYDPVTQLWSVVPELPVPDLDPVVAGGADSLLACFGYDTVAGAYGDGCSLLRPSAASLQAP